MSSHPERFLASVIRTCYALNVDDIAVLADAIGRLRAQDGRLFILGLGGSAANASHAVNDFVKLCGVKTYAPSDNVSEMTARANDTSWENWIADWLEARKPDSCDAILVLSVGGGAANVSIPLIRAIQYAKACDTKVFGIVGRDGGFTKQNADVCVMVPVVDSELVTPLTESFQSIVLHALCSHPALAIAKAKWESLA